MSGARLIIRSIALHDFLNPNEHRGLWIIQMMKKTSGSFLKMEQVLVDKPGEINLEHFHEDRRTQILRYSKKVFLDMRSTIQFEKNDLRQIM